MSESISRTMDEGAKHLLPIEHFDALAAGRGDADTIRALHASEHSRRLVLLCELLDRLTDDPYLLGPLPAVAKAWDLLAAIEQTASHDLAAVIMHPQVGIWMSHTVRRITYSAVANTPVWVEAGHIYSVILAAAIRSGAGIRVQVPVRRGNVDLPTLGLVRLRPLEGYLVADAETSNGSVVFHLGDQSVTIPKNPGAATPNWWGLRRLRCQSAGRTLDLALDDIDPYRDLADPVEPGRLDEAVVTSWRNRVRNAWDILNRRHEMTADAIEAGLWSITPLPDNPEWDVRSASTGDAFGAAVMSLPPDAMTMAVTMVHEFQHNKLGGLLHLVDLVLVKDQEPNLYAPWRPDPRPRAGLLQGVYAFLGITAFWRRQRDIGSPAARKIADFEFALARRQTWAGLRVLYHAGQMTHLGRRLLEGMKRELRPWLREPVPPEAGRASWAAFADHRAGWRLRNLEVDRAWLFGAVTAWRRQEEPPPVAGARVSVSAAGAVWAQRRLATYRVRLRTESSGLRTARQTSEAEPSAAVNQSDALLLGGFFGEAEEEYRRTIEREPTDFDAWAGLGLAVAARDGLEACRLLLHRPELAYAVYVALNLAEQGPAPLTVAQWLTG